MLNNGVWGIFRLRGVFSALSKKKFRARRLPNGDWAVIEKSSPIGKDTRIIQRVITGEEFCAAFCPLDETAQRSMAPTEVVSG